MVGLGLEGIVVIHRYRYRNKEKERKAGKGGGKKKREGRRKGKTEKGRGAVHPLEVSQLCLGLEGIVVIHCYR